MNDEIQTAISRLEFFHARTLRQSQTTPLDFIAKSTKRFIAIEGPTGTGKSAIGVIAGIMSGRATYVVHSKSLQEQIEYEFPEVIVLMGRSNYECGYDEARHGGQCTPSKQQPCIPATCDYARQKAKCMAAAIKCLNYPYLFTEANYAGNQLGDAAMVVCDEADTIEDGLSRFISLSITSTMVKEYGLTMPKFKTADKEHKLLEWKEWAKGCAIKLAGIQRGRRAEFQGQTIPEDIQEEIDKAGSVLMGFDLFQRNVDGSWLYEEDKRRYGTTHIFSPLWLTKELSSKFLWSHNKRWILMSATLPPPEALCRQLGIPIGELDYIRVPSPFDPKRSPIYLTKSWDGRRKTEEFPERFDIHNAVRDVNVLLDKHREVKGIIHTTSYKVRDAIMEGCQQKIFAYGGEWSNDRLMTHNSKDRTAVLSNFLNSPLSVVLVSPSMDRGVSLPHDKCRFSIVVKNPWGNIKDKKINKRKHDKAMNGREWYLSDAAQKLIQAVGRGMRSEDDWCINYLIDSSTHKFVFENPGLFNEHFRKCIVLGGAEAWKGEVTIEGVT